MDQQEKWRLQQGWVTEQRHRDQVVAVALSVLGIWGGAVGWLWLAG